MLSLGPDCELLDWTKFGLFPRLQVGPRNYLLPAVVLSALARLVGIYTSSAFLSSVFKSGQATQSQLPRLVPVKPHATHAEKG